ncbi:MAG: FadR/GntR family transcriptional regulator [Ramlibacter sp.]
MIHSNIRVPKTSELVASRIRNAIVRGELKPGDTLPLEAQLISDFEVSRATVREAIRILEFEGLITLSRGMRGGARVNEIGADVLARITGTLLQARGATIGEVYQVRMLIEPPAARLSAQNRPEQACEALRQQLAVEYAMVDDYGKLSVALADFHRVLLEQCGNVTIGVVGQALHGVVQTHLRLAHRLKPADQARYLKLARRGLQGHEKLIELIEARNGPGAEAHWLGLMEATSDYWLAGLSTTSFVDVLE